MFDNTTIEKKQELYGEYLHYKRRIEPHDTYWDWLESCLLTEREKVKQLSALLKDKESALEYYRNGGFNRNI